MTLTGNVTPAESRETMLLWKAREMFPDRELRGKTYNRWQKPVIRGKRGKPCGNRGKPGKM